MADGGLAIAASALQVAEFGFSLAKSIHDFVITAKDAPKDLASVEQDVYFLSVVLRNADTQIESTSNLRKNQVNADLRKVLEGTKNAFQKIQTLMSELGRSPTGFATRVEYALTKKAKIEVLKANLEQRKSNLLLMINVIVLGSMSKATTKDEDAVEVAKLELKTLLEAKKEAEEKYQDLEGSFARLQNNFEMALRHTLSSQFPALIVPPIEPERDALAGASRSSAPREQTLETLTRQGRAADVVQHQHIASVSGAEELSHPGTSRSSSRTTTPQGPDIEPDPSRLPAMTIAESLRQCTTAIESLDYSIHLATRRLQQGRKIDRARIRASQSDVDRAIEDLYDSIKDLPTAKDSHLQKGNNLHRSGSLASNSSNEWDHRNRPRRRPSPHQLRPDARRISTSGDGGLYKSRSQGKSQAPTINVYNRMFSDQEDSPYPPYNPYTRPPVLEMPRAAHNERWGWRGRAGDELADDLAEMALEHKYRSRARGRGRSHASAFDHPPAPPAGLAEWQLAQREAVSPREEAVSAVDSVSSPFEEIDQLLHRWTTVEED